MNLIFQLSMPGCPSWNGRWSGEGKLYAIVKNFSTIKGKERAREILAKRSFYYRWSDGWAANISVMEATPEMTRATRKRSHGFCGYDWMVQSILVRGCIKADHEIEIAQAKPPGDTGGMEGEK